MNDPISGTLNVLYETADDGERMTLDRLITRAGFRELGGPIKPEVDLEAIVWDHAHGYRSCERCGKPARDQRICSTCVEEIWEQAARQGVPRR